MLRPCFLVIDQDYPGTISTRKLVIETAKFNVITAYSGREAVETLRRFPKLHGVVLDAKIHDVPCPDLVRELKGIVPEIPVIVTSGRGYADCGEVEHHLESYDPKQLLGVLQSMYPDQVDEVLQHDRTKQ